MDDGPYWVILLMYGFHDMRRTGFRILTVVNGTPGFWGVTFLDWLATFERDTLVGMTCRMKCGFNLV